MIDVLVAEDDPAALHLTLKALRLISSQIRPHVARTGAQALAFLRKTAPFEDAPTPDLLLLDWNLPRVHGRAVLAAARNDAGTAALPIAVLTTSDAEADRTDAQLLGVSRYIVKASGFGDFVESLRSVTAPFVAVNPSASPPKT